MSTNLRRHVSDELMQAHLDGELPAREAASVEAHLVSCARCSAEHEGWSLLYDELGTLPANRPHEGFHDRVMAAVDVPQATPLPERLRTRLGDMLHAARRRHLPADRIEELFEGFLPARQVARVQAHLGECEECGARADALHRVFRALNGIGRFEPAEDFADRVMACVRPAPAPSKVRLRARVLAVARRFAPQTRRAWAAVSGVAVTPAATVGLMLYAVFTHPALTLGSLASYVWWQVSDAAAALWSSASALALESLQTSGMFSIVEFLGSAPLLLAGGFVVYVIACGLALRVIYKQVFASHPSDGRYAHVSAS